MIFSVYEIQLFSFINLIVVLNIKFYHIYKQLPLKVSIIYYRQHSLTIYLYMKPQYSNSPKQILLSHYRSCEVPIIVLSDSSNQIQPLLLNPTDPSQLQKPIVPSQKSHIHQVTHKSRKIVKYMKTDYAGRLNKINVKEKLPIKSSEFKVATKIFFHRKNIQNGTLEFRVEFKNLAKNIIIGTESISEQEMLKQNPTMLIEYLEQNFRNTFLK